MVIKFAFSILEGPLKPHYQIHQGNWHTLMLKQCLITHSKLLIVSEWPFHPFKICGASKQKKTSKHAQHMANMAAVVCHWQLVLHGYWLISLQTSLRHYLCRQHQLCSVSSWPAANENTNSSVVRERGRRCFSCCHTGKIIL